MHVVRLLQFVTETKLVMEIETDVEGGCKIICSDDGGERQIAF